ncbi:hypothetical protein PhCBS80983_g03715 [Powellomyces hirtus]|uniref:Uncharacterized protein n=1 Tax=Powellomyces hirtus TaxID=109895 RepID=A0A507E0G6_9FUNG|nr:hypothetical protein PhCBS80983_g03715 [Powellomyces hirtus]
MTVDAQPEEGTEDELIQILKGPEYTGNFEADFIEACRRHGCKPLSVLTVHHPLPPLPIPITPRPQSVAGECDLPSDPDVEGPSCPRNANRFRSPEDQPSDPLDVPDANASTVDSFEGQKEQKVVPTMNYASRFRFVPTIVLETAEEDEEDLQKLEVRGWNITPEIMEIICGLVVACGTLSHLVFWNCGLTAAHMSPLISALAQTSIRTLSLDQNPHVPPALFAELITEDSPVRHLSLRSTQLGDTGAKAIAEQLKVNKTLVNLNLWDNQIGKDGAEALADALRINQTLLSLSLGLNNIGDEGVSAMAKMLSNYPLSHDELASRRKAMADMDKQRKDQEEDPVVKKNMKRNLTSGGTAATAGRNNSAKLGTRHVPHKAAETVMARAHNSLDIFHLPHRIQSVESINAAAPGKKETVAADAKKKAVKGGAAGKADAAPAASKVSAGALSTGKKGPSEAPPPPAAAAAKKGGAAATTAASAPDDKAAKGGKNVKGAAPVKGGKKGKAEEVKEEAEEVVDVTPASEPMFEHNGQWFVLGNRSLNNLNLYGNVIREEGLKALWDALQEQDLTAEHAPEGTIGLFRLTLQANSFEVNHGLHERIMTFLNARNPYYENHQANTEPTSDSQLDAEKTGLSDGGDDPAKEANTSSS